MTITDARSTWELQCDGCAFAEELEKDDAQTFQDAVEYLKAEGWKIVRRGGAWLHHCPHCAERPVGRGEP